MNIDGLHISVKARELIEGDEFNKKAIEGFDDRPNLKKFSFFMYRDVDSEKLIRFADKTVLFRDSMRR